MDMDHGQGLFTAKLRTMGGVADDRTTHPKNSLRGDCEDLCGLPWGLVAKWTDTQIHVKHNTMSNTLSIPVRLGLCDAA